MTTELQTTLLEHSTELLQIIFTFCTTPWGIGILAGIFQALGYYFYMRDEQIDPHPLTWLMFGYGTLILTVLEWEKDATLEELFLPMICTALGLYVMIRAWHKALRLRKLRNPNLAPQGIKRFWPDEFWPDDRWERWSFGTDLAVTVGYLAVLGYAYVENVLGGTFNSLAELLASDNSWVLAFLVLSNLTVLSEFFPLLKETWKNPHKEHPLPWAVWTIAYALLGVVTYMHHGFFTVLMMYPVLNVAMHGAAAAVASRRFR